MVKQVNFLSAEASTRLTEMLEGAAHGRPAPSRQDFADLITSGQLPFDGYVSSALGLQNLLQVANAYKNEELALALLGNDQFVGQFTEQIWFWPSIWSIAVLDRVAEIKGSVVDAIATENSLHRWAIDYADEKPLTWFVERGMPIDAIGHGGARFLPLHRFASVPDVARFDLFLRVGADPYVTDDAGRSFLHAAVMGGWSRANKLLDDPSRAEQVRDLLVVCNNHFLDLNRQDDNGHTALHLAAKLGYVNVAVELVQAGADMHAKDHRNKTPFDLAKSSKRHDTVAALAAARARNTILETVRRAGAARKPTSES